MKDLLKLRNIHLVFQKIMDMEEVWWENSKRVHFKKAIENVALTKEDIEDAHNRLKRFAPFIRKSFKETENRRGIIESPLKEIPNMKDAMQKHFKEKIEGSLLLKCDSHLPISGSIKARGGIYEVLKHAEDLAIKKGMLKIEDNYEKLTENRFKEFYNQYSIAVGSTGNLGLSIGIISAKLGFKVTVHMSKDAKPWKKELLREKGVNVIEYASDYSKAVEEGRRISKKDPKSYFIDDENSKNLFLGYSVAGLRLKEQLEDLNRCIDQNHPLVVYLPCGVGGGPGGVAFGLKQVYKDHVHCYFAEPTHSPAMLLGCMTGKHNKICVQDFGIDNETAADGLAVGRPSGFVGKTMEKLLEGIYTVKDDTLFRLLTMLYDSENIFLEPSALAGMYGPIGWMKTMKKSVKDFPAATHIIWATGGSMVPNEEREACIQRGKILLNKGFKGDEHEI